MEHQKNDNLNMLEAVVQNTEMGKNTLAQILPELIRQRSGYQELNQEAHAGLDACGSRAQGQSAFAKMNTKMGISFKTLTDKSTRNLAEMLSEGSSQGIMDCIKCQKDYPDAAPGTKRLMQRLQAYEKIPSSRHARMDGIHTGKFSAESVRAALRRVRGSALNFVPRGILGGRNFCRATARRNGFPLKRGALAARCVL